MKLLSSRILCCICVFVAALSHAQGGFKRFHYLSGSLSSTAADVIETPDQKYLIAGRTYTVINNVQVSRLTFLLTNLNGDTLQTRRYGDEFLNYPDWFQRNQFYCADSKHVFVYTTGQDNAGNIFPVLFKLTYQGDTIWRKVYPWDPIANLIPQVMVKARDGGFYLGGYYQQKAGGHPIFLWRISDNGDLLWSKIINKAAPNVMSGSDLLQDSASRKLIITGYQHIGNGSYSSVLIVDSLGNKLAHKYFNDGCGGAAGILVALKDGNFVTGMQMSVNCNIGIYQGKIVKFDIDGNFIWEKKMVPSGPLNGIEVRRQKFNSDLIATGVLDSNMITKFKYMVLDQAGNIKHVASYGRKSDVFDIDLQRGGSFTSDGGYITAMQVRDDPAPRPFYIIKLDSMGCDTTPQYCAWQQTVALKEQKQLLQAEIFPNPCNDVLNIGISGNSFPAQVRVFDQSGRLLREEEAVGKEHALQITDLPQGLYLLEVRSSAGVFRGNFVVQR